MSERWNSPTTVIALISLLLSISGNIFQYFTFQRDTEKWDNEKANFVIQRNDLQKRLKIFEDDHEIRQQRITEVKKQIDKLSLDIEGVKREISGTYNIMTIAIGSGFNRGSEEETNDATSRAEVAKDKIVTLMATKERLEKEKVEMEKVYNVLVSKRPDF